jgi:8-oxo-dGTP pyrophosphatase MutT (NUDIX family)
MTLRRHIATCNSWERARFLPFWHEAARLGLVRRDHAEMLRRFPRVFLVTSDSVRLVAKGDPAALTAAIDEAVVKLVASGAIAKWRKEFLAVAERWGGAVRFNLDRGAAPFFGIRAYGVHLNGYRMVGDAMKLWIGRRAKDKLVAPDKLDNLVAGGIGDGHGVIETLHKEAEEEAGIPAPLIAQARPAGAISYRMETKWGLRDDALFVYDLDMPADFEPKNQDGELASFELMDAEAALDRVRQTDDFKFNVNLVVIDFAIRHGLIGPDDPEYLTLATGLRRPVD